MASSHVILIFIYLTQQHVYAKLSYRKAMRNVVCYFNGHRRRGDKGMKGITETYVRDEVTKETNPVELQ